MIFSYVLDIAKYGKLYSELLNNVLQYFPYIFFIIFKAN